MLTFFPLDRAISTIFSLIGKAKDDQKPVDKSGAVYFAR